MKRPALFRRVPKLRTPSSYPLLPPGVAKEFAALEPDINILEQKLFKQFEALDGAALKSQNGFRLAQVLLILGGLLATLLGAIQIAQPHTAWAGITEAILVAALAFVFQVSGEINFKQDYLDQRLKAERMRAECFFYLARVGQYSALDSAASSVLLEHRVALIQTGGS